MKTVGEILRNAREDRDLTQKDVMAATGINNKTLSGYENGVSEPDLKTFATLMNLYGLSADDVLGIRRQGGESLSSSERRLLSEFRKRSPSQQKNILTVLEVLSSDNDI